MAVVLVTGAFGYIGSTLVPMLNDKGYTTIGLDTGYYSMVGDASTVLFKDIRDINESDLVDNKVDAIIHLAALSNDPLGNLNPRLTRDINFRASIRLIRLAKKIDRIKRFIFSSSCSVYGNSNKDFVNEESSVNPLSVYAQSKVDVEHELLYSCERDFCSVILRNATVYGPARAFRSDLVINDLMCSAIYNKEVKLKSNGQAIRPVIHIQDVCKAMLWALEAPVDIVNGEIFNIGWNTFNYPISELASQIAITTETKVTFEDTKSDPRSYCVDFTKFYRASNLVPQNLVSAIVSMVPWIETYIGYHDYFDKKHVRLNQLQKWIDGNQLDASLRWRE